MHRNCFDDENFHGEKKKEIIMSLSEVLEGTCNYWIRLINDTFSKKFLVSETWYSDFLCDMTSIWNQHSG